MNIKACIFDLDGTIINTVGSLRYCTSEAIALFGYPPVTDEEAMRFVGNGTRVLLRRSLEKYGDTDEEHYRKVITEYKRVFQTGCTRGNYVYEGLPEVLKSLKKQGIRLAVISNKPDEQTRKCVYDLYGRDLFELVYGEREGIPLKPDPTALKMLIAELGVEPSECLYFGDGDTDVNASNAAGCHTAAVTWGFRSREILEKCGPEFMIDRPEDILKLVM